MWNDLKIIDSTDNNVRKIVYSKNNAVAESVLYKYPTYNKRTVICCSTQSGCPVGCRFCGTGDYFVRNLTVEEIIYQVEFSLFLTGTNMFDKLQIMFMSMGEPFLNYNNVAQAIRRLYDKYPVASLLVSTIGPDVDYSNFIDLSMHNPIVGLQFSIHESTDEARNKLIPFKNKLSLREIASVGTEWHRYTDRKPFFNYCADSHNTSDQDANNLFKLFDPNVWECTISVVCERNEGMPAKNDHQINLAKNFSDKMLSRGYNVRVFDPAGQDDIGGGCGQLWFVQKWMENNKDLAAPSIGHNKPKVHTPKGE